MIDLSYLTEEEQEVILKVLKRDAHLKKVEEERIKTLRKTERDSSVLKCLSGEWFYETTSSKHRGRIHGSDIIRESISGNRPVTILEISEIWPEKPSFLNSEIKDIFIPPELCGLIEVPSHPQHTGEELIQQDNDKVATYPQAKARQNPFNKRNLEFESSRKAALPSRERVVHPAEVQQTYLTHVDTDQAPADTQQTPADTHQAPADTHRAPADTHKAPGDTHRAPGDTHRAPADTHQTPVDTHRAPADTHQTPVDTHRTPADTQQTPADTHQIPVDTHRAPADTHQTPADTHRAPADTHQTPADTHRAPADTHKAPADTDQTPAGWQLLTVEPVEPEGQAGPQPTPPVGQHEDGGSSLVSEPHISVAVQDGEVEPIHGTASLKQTSIRPISISKSLEDMATLASLSAGHHAPGSTVSDMELMKLLSVSVPAFSQQQSNGKESDFVSVDTIYSESQRKDGTNTNLSSCSSLVTLSSVSSSAMNIHKCDVDNVEVKGTVQFAMSYVEQLGELNIFIVQCRNLSAAEPKKNRSDPYVKCYLLPDKVKLGKRKTSVKKKTLNPTYNEILRYKIPLDSLKDHTLNISVWHNDLLGRNSFLGEVNIALSEWDSTNTNIMDCALKGRVPVQSSPKHASVEMKGEVKVALRFILPTSSNKKIPQTGEIQIWVKECKNLPSKRGDTFVKCTVLPDTGQKGAQKTHTVKKTANPAFNYTMVYDDVRPEDLREACVELTVWQHDGLSNHFIGGTRLGLGTGKSYGAQVNWMDSNTAEAGLWKRMIESQNEWVEDVVPLRMLIMAKTMAR